MDKDTSPTGSSESPEFNLREPLRSFRGLLGAIFLAPRQFYLNFSADGPVKEPAIFALLVGAFAAILSALLVLLVNLSGLEIRGARIGLAEIGIAGGILLSLVFALVSPLIVAVGAGVYLLVLKTFVGEVANYRQLYRIFGYAYAPMLLALMPVVGAFAFTYATLVLMAIAIRSVYRTSFLTALITALVGFVPMALAATLLIVLSSGLFAG